MSSDICNGFWYPKAGTIPYFGTLQQTWVLFSTYRYPAADLGTLHQISVPCSRLGYSSADIGTLQQTRVLFSRYWYPAADVGTLQQILVPCSRLGYSSTDIGTLQQTWVLFSRYRYSAADLGTIQQTSVFCSCLRCYAVVIANAVFGICIGHRTRHQSPVL